MAKGKYEEWLTLDGLTRLEAYARDGLTDEQIAHNMGVSIATLYNYKRDHLAILDALKRGKEVVDIQVENKLFQRAMGYSYKETTREAVSLKDECGKVYGSEMQITKIVTKEVAPDVTAQIFWLKNRKPREWRDKTDIDYTGTLITKVERMTEDELQDELKKYE